MTFQYYRFIVCKSTKFFEML